jgi:hypothetical protein
LSGLIPEELNNKSCVGYSIQPNWVWWKEGADEALHRWSKHHQQLKVAKGQNFRQLLVMKPEVIFCGICVHDLSFLVCCENGGNPLLTAPTMWWGALLGCIFCGMVIFALELIWWWSIQQWNWMEIKVCNWSKCRYTELSEKKFFALRWRDFFLEDSLCGLHFVGEIVVHYAMFLLRKDAWQ